MEKKEEYKYYSTQRPVGPGTFPRLPDNPPVEIANYDERRPVEGGAFRAWGELIYAKPLTEKEAEDYELRPSTKNPDIWRRMSEQAQVVGPWEDGKRIPDQQRLTWYYSDFGSYVPKDFVTPEALAARVHGIVAQRAARARNEGKKPPIARQMEQAGKQAGENRGTPAPKKEAPDKGDR